MEAANMAWKETGIRNAVTVAFWLKTTTSISSGTANGTLFSFGSSSAAERLQAHAPWGGNAYFDYGGTGSWARVSGPITANYENWTHYAMVSEGNSGNFKGIYVNGELKYGGPGTTNGVDVVQRGFRLGSNLGSSRQRGILDEFAVYGRVLSQDEIRAHYLNGAP